VKRELFAIFGNPVSHSKSPLMHNLAFKALGYNGCYGRYLLEDGKRLKEKFLTLNLKGANITVPHKESAFRACDELDSFALKVGSVNTIVKRGSRLYGYNTDAPGFLKAISEFDTKDILLIGAGGTAKAVSEVLRDEGFSVTILNRGSKRLESFRELGFECFSWEEFKFKNYDLIVNMTSAGLSDDLLPAPKEILEPLIANSKAVVDIIYSKETPFLKMAKEFKKPFKDGSDMLLYQGIIAFRYFTDNRYSFNEIRSVMKRAFEL